MVIGSITVQAGATVLADGTDSGGRCTDLSINGFGLVQLAEIFRAGTISLFARENFRNSATVKIEQFQSSTTQALARVFSESDTGVPSVGYWTFFFSPDGISTIQASFYAKVEVDRKFVGSSTIFEYKLVGSTFTVTTTGLLIIDGGTASQVPADVLSDGTGSFTPADIYDFGSAAAA